MDALLSIDGEKAARKLATGKNVWPDIASLKKTFRAPSSLESDLLNVAAFIYAADLAAKRNEREEFVRNISLRIPVTNSASFTALRSHLEDILRVLSHDNWNIEFEASSGVLEPQVNWPHTTGSTLLFSGGLDSLAGACELLSKEAKPLLVSHVTHNRPVATAQSTLVKHLQKHFKLSFTHLTLQFYCRNQTAYPFPQDTEREETQRTRSFLFLALAAVAARMNGSRRVLVMAENGQFAIHLPLTPARVGAFSTHTAHPEFLCKMQEFLRVLFFCPDLSVSNPFVNMTKAEVVGRIPDDLRPAIAHSISCWMTSRLSSHTHCGECVPCLSRRLSLEQHDIKLKEYKRDLLRQDISSLPPDDNGKRNLVDLLEFIARFYGPHAITDEQELSIEFPELFNPFVVRRDAIAMYRRFAASAASILKGYRKVAPLLK